MRSWLLISGMSAVLVFGCCGKKNASTTGKAETQDQRREAPKHNAPDQERIDSLKQEKLKNKQ